MTRICKTCMCQTCLFVCVCVCLHDMSLSCVLLDPASIVFDATCAYGTPWTFLLTSFNRLQNGRWKCCNFLKCLIIMLVQHWEFDVTEGGLGDGCVRLVLSIDRLILLVILIIGTCSRVSWCSIDCPLDKSHTTLNSIFNKINVFFCCHFVRFAFVANY